MLQTNAVATNAGSSSTAAIAVCCQRMLKAQQRLHLLDAANEYNGCNCWTLQHCWMLQTNAGDAIGEGVCGFVYTVHNVCFFSSVAHASGADRICRGETWCCCERAIALSQLRPYFQAASVLQPQLGRQGGRGVSSSPGPALRGSATAP
jgi:hypothetical protein